MHLLFLGKALADDGVDGRLRKRGRDPLTVSEALAVVDDAAGVPGDVGRELMRRLGEVSQVRVVLR